MPLFNDGLDDDKDLTQVVERFEEMIRTRRHYFFDALELEEIIQYYVHANNPRKALDVTDIAVEQYPYSTNFMLTRAQLLASTGELKDALDLLNKVQTFDPYASELYIIKGAIYTKLGKRKKARDYFNRAIIHADRLDEIYLDIALECESLGNFDEAIYFLKKSYRVNPDNHHTLNELAFCYDITDQLEESVRFYEALIDNDPYNELAWFNLGVSYSKLDNAEKALEAFDYAGLIKEDFADAHFERGEVLATQGHYEKAIEAYLEAAQHDESARILYCIGECHEEMEQYVRARKYYKKALRFDKNLSDAWFGIGVTLFYEEQAAEAIPYVRKAIELDEYNGEYWYILGDMYCNLKQYGGAEQAYRNVTRLEPFKSDIWLDYADLLHKQGKTRKAVNVLMEGLREHPGNADLVYRLSGYLITGDEKEEGMRHLEDALSTDFEKHSLLFKAFPRLKRNPEIAYLIELYKR